MREVEVGSNVWIGYGACFLRGVRVGDNSVVGTNSVVTKDVAANAVVGGVPAKAAADARRAREPALAEPGRALAGRPDSERDQPRGHATRPRISPSSSSSSTR